VENRRRRVPALAPEERRAALIAATIPLLHEHGVDVSTKQIAQAAGVAEGTIFGVFETKSSLVTCSVMQALDPQPTLDALAGIDRGLPLRARLIAAADLVHRRFTDNAPLMSAARFMVMSGAAHGETRTRMTAARGLLQAAIADVLAPDAHRLRRSPPSVARLVLLFCGAASFGPFGDPDAFSAEETASLLLDGLLEHSPDDKRGSE
jgi:AcrR family transcriptional regulator